MPQPSTTPRDAQALARAFEAIERDAAELIEGLSDEQLNWQPEPGKSWSIAQCLDHLNVTDAAYLGPIEATVAHAAGAGGGRDGAPVPIRPGFLEWLFIRAMEPPPKRRLPAPRSIVPASRRSKDEVWPEFQRLHRRLRDFAAGLGGLDVNRVRFTNPFVKLIKVPVGAGLLIIEAHDRRHLWQARKVKTAPGFPGRV